MSGKANADPSATGHGRTAHAPRNIDGHRIQREGKLMPAQQVSKGRSRERRRDPDRTRGEILDVATTEFATNGFAGARVDEIAAQTRTTKRMIYYYFESKEGLFVAVLERAYGAIRSAEQAVDVDHLDPPAAVRRLAELTFDHHESHPDFIRLVSIENIHHGEHMRKSATLRNLNSPAIELIHRILERGYASGAFRRRVEAIDLHVMISSFCVFRIANRHTFGALFDHDLTDPALRDTYRRMLGDMVVGYLAGDPAD
jgi:AcrR family transcriptional regulator